MFHEKNVGCLTSLHCLFWWSNVHTSTDQTWRIDTRVLLFERKQNTVFYFLSLCSGTNGYTAKSRFYLFWMFNFGIATFVVKQTDPLTYRGMSFFAGALWCATIALHIAVTQYMKRRNVLIRFGDERIQEVEQLSFVLFNCYFFQADVVRLIRKHKKGVCKHTVPSF